VNFSGGWYPYAPLTTPYYANAGHSAADKAPQLWLYADNDKLYDEAQIRGYYEAFTAAGGHARFELLHGVPGDGHPLRLYIPTGGGRWRTNSWQRSICTGPDAFRNFAHSKVNWPQCTAIIHASRRLQVREPKPTVFSVGTFFTASGQRLPNEISLRRGNSSPTTGHPEETRAPAEPPERGPPLT
jgi:hypothetical protein